MNPAELSPDQQRMTLRLCPFHVNDQLRWYCCVFGGSPCGLFRAIFAQKKET
jgi:hypothetical protein